MTVNPLGFLVIKETGSVEFISIAAASSASTAVSIVDTVADFLGRSPELIDKVKKIFKGNKEDGESEPPDAE